MRPGGMGRRSSIPCSVLRRPATRRQRCSLAWGTGDKTRNTMIFQILLLIFLLACSAFFSGSETALFALSRYELRQFQRRRGTGRLVAELLRHPRRLLLTLMIGNVTINTFIFATSLALFQQVTGQHTGLAALLGLISPVMVTLFGEILPKGMAIDLRERFAPRAAPLVQVIQWVLSPVTFLLRSLLVEPCSRLLTGGKPYRGHVTADEVREWMEIDDWHRVVQVDENIMLDGVIRLGELSVRGVMVPRVDIEAFEVDDDPAKLRRIMREQHFSKLPVYEEDIDRVLGVVHMKDVFLNPQRPLRELLRPVHFVPEQINLMQLLAHFRRTRSQMAMVVNEFGGIVGLVSMEDVAEEIVGELTLPGEESDKLTWVRLDEHRYRVWGGVSIHEWAQEFGVDPLDERVNTLAGLLIDQLGRLPVVGDQARMGNLRLTVESLQGRRIAWILMEILPDEPASEEGGPP